MTKPPGQRSGTGASSVLEHMSRQTEDEQARQERLGAERGACALIAPLNHDTLIGTLDQLL